MNAHFHASCAAVLVGLVVATPAAAGPTRDRADMTAGVNAVVQDLGAGRGALTTATLEFQTVSPAGSWTLAPTLGHREQAGLVQTALGGSIAWHHDWSSRIATSSEAFLAESHGPFALASMAQSLTGRLGRKTALTAALRWSRYQGGQNVWFVSAEARRYVRRGSAAYRLTWIKPADRNGYTSHLVSLTLNDAGARGRTQLWLSQGQAFLATSHGPDSFRGHDRAVQVRRVQPIGPHLALSLAGGLAYYDLPSGAVQSRNVGLGLSLEF